MKPTLQYGAFMASLLLVLPSVAAFADSGSGSQASQILQLQMGVMTCRNTYSDGFLNDVVTAVNNGTITSTLSSTDIPKLNTDYSAIQADASANNTSQFKTDVKTYSVDTNTAIKDSHTELVQDHSKTVNKTLRSDLGQLKSTENNCLVTEKQQYAQYREQMFNKDLMRT